MPARTSIELHSTGCRLVEVEVARRGRRAPLEDVRIRSFVARVPEEADEGTFAMRLARLRHERKLARHAWVTIWGLRSVQQVLRLPPARPDDLEALAMREARKDLVSLETDGERASIGLIVGGEVQAGSHRRREVSLVAVSANEVRQRIQPLVESGFVIEGVLTPALALTATARSQRELAPENAIAYVALGTGATCLAVVRDGLLLFAREIPWGHGTIPDPVAETSVAARLTSELRRSVLFFKQTFRSPVESVVLCGDMPDLRAVTAPLNASLGIPVRTLDSLTGIDAAHLPEPADELRVEAAAFRLAIAVGADPGASANLLPKSIRVARAGRTRLARVAASMAASAILLGGGYALQARAAGAHRREAQALRDHIARLEPESQRRDGLQQANEVATAQGAALRAFETQGPRLARLLEALSSGTPDDIVITGVTVQPETTRWRATLTGIAVTEDPAAGQASVAKLLQELSASPFAGVPVQPPALRVVSGSRGAGAASTGAVPALVSAHRSGVEFAVSFFLVK